MAGLYRVTAQTGILTVPRAPARCTQWNGVQAAFWLLWGRPAGAA